MNQTNKLTDVTALDELNKNSHATPSQLEANINTLELLAEQPVVAVERMEVGKVQFRKEIRTKQIQLPITLKQEVLIIDHVPNSQLAQPLPDTTLHPKSSTDPSDWDTWIKIDNANGAVAKILVNGQPHDFSKPLEVVISQEFAHVQIQTLLAETVHVTTTTEEHVQSIPVQLRHEELVTNRVDYETPQVLYRKEVDTTTEPNAINEIVNPKK